MTASEKLAALNNGHTLSGLKVVPIFRKRGPWLAGADAFERARDVEKIMDALPEILMVVDAAESVGRMEMWPPDAERLNATLDALDKALS